MASAAILDFRNFELLTVRAVKRVELHHCANFVDIVRTAAEIWRFFDFTKMAAVRHLGFVMHLLGPPTKGLYHCVKFGWNRCSSLDNMHAF